MTTLDEIEKRLEAATPGPWRKADPSGFVETCQSDVATIAQFWNRHEGDYENWEANASLIAHSPADIEYLLGIVEAAAAWKAARDAWLDVAADGSYCTGAANALSDARAALRKALEASDASTLKPTD